MKPATRAAICPTSVAAAAPSSAASSNSLTRMNSAAARTSAGGAAGGAGARFHTTRAPAACQRSALANVVAGAISYCSSTTAGVAAGGAGRGAGAGTCSTPNCTLAPGTTTIWFSPCPPTTISAIPEACSGTVRRPSTPTPACRRLARPACP